MNIIAGILDTEIALAIPGTYSFAKNRLKWHYFFKKFHIFVRTPKGLWVRGGKLFETFSLTDQDLRFSYHISHMTQDLTL